MPAQTRPAQTTNLFLLEDLEDVSRTSELRKAISYGIAALGF
jgi:hypothetical protein